MNFTVEKIPIAPGLPVRIKCTGIDSKERTPHIGYIGEVIWDGDTVRVTVHGADKFVWDRLGPPPFPPPFSDRVSRPPAFDYWWRRLDWVFGLPDPRSFPPLPTTLPDEERAIVQRYVRVAGDLAHSSLLNSPKESYSYQLPQGPGGPEQIEKSFSPKDVQVGFAGLLRQADSGDEPANLHLVSRILMVASEAAQDDRHDERIKQLKAWRYAVKELHNRSLDQLSRNKLVQEGLQLFAYKEEHSPKELLNLYNYGDLIHWQKHRDVIAGFEQDEYVATDRQLAYLESAQSLGHLYVGFGELARHAMGEAPPERSRRGR
jgi:hypothetical protein